jgi:hypothetical protein
MHNEHWCGLRTNRLGNNASIDIREYRQSEEVSSRIECHVLRKMQTGYAFRRVEFDHDSDLSMLSSRSSVDWRLDPW